ncbi:transcription factor MUTE [Punica granatum]|uniref:BHLH domain-containing protein n=2 Tax=Punica granatum TaxID=22663 RepID=A0A218WBL6_PUNGR|nr:transcription factor MUTE [Punica granatum]OWM69848.1 hypothetical protein CDL15_Pgr025697 [Punica granatum]PKI64916.1 hypothetical protein CRG98_014712 [Punica granatum]
MSHIAVERNRRRQMNEHLKVLRSLTPCFYIKRGDQASIIGGAIEFIKELHQVLQSLEAKKRRKSLSPSSPSPSPRPLQLIGATPPPDSPFSFGCAAANKELAGGACCNSRFADIEARISGSNVILKVIARRIPGQIVKIIAVLEKLSFEILHLNISSMEDTVLYSFVVKIGLECRLSLEELVLEIQKSFSPDTMYAAEA